MRPTLRWLFVGALAAAGVIGSCYATTDTPPPCANIAHCNDPAGLPPVWDRRAPDAGSERGDR